ncbi:MAG TPA: hypothetical protein ENI07_09675 [Desulfobacterales bacterium]|nr:hypothetical protein [Desulfobacterales bacterium]
MAGRLRVLLNTPVKQEKSTGFNRARTSPQYYLPAVPALQRGAIEKAKEKERKIDQSNKAAQKRLKEIQSE